MSSSPATASPATLAGSRTIPVRAIPSNLAIKTAPTLPPSTDSYEPLVKAVLRHRLVYHIFLQSGLLTWSTVSIATLWHQDIISLNFSQVLFAPFRPFTLLVSFVVWALIALPIIVLRKSLLTSIRTPATSPATSLSIALGTPSRRRALAAYAASALLLVGVHSFMACVLESTDPKLRLFVKSKKHPYYLNGRILFLVISQLAIAISYGIRNIMLDRFVFKWNIASQKDDTNTNISPLGIIRIFIISTLLSVLALPVAATVFAVARFFLPILYKLPIVSSFLRPFTAHFLRGSWTVLLPLQHTDLIRRSFALEFMTFFIWEIADTLFDLNVAKQIPVAHLTADSNLTLVSGISSSDPTFKYFAYSELCTLAEDKSAAAISQRTTLFSDQKYSPTLWARLAREGLLLLGRDYQLFLRRGEPEPPAVTAAPLTAAVPTGSVASSSVPLLRRRIFKGSEEDASDPVLDVLASDGPISRAVDANVNAIDLPEIFRSAEAKVMPKAIKEEVQKSVDNTKSAVATTKQRIHQFASGVYKKHVPPVAAEYLDTWLRWWKIDRTSKIVEKALPSRELDIVVVEVISRLTCASLTEDRYGVVQRDIPRILEAFLSFLSAIEEYQIKVNSLYVAPKPDENLTSKELQERETLRYEVEKAGEVLGAMADGTFYYTPSVQDETVIANQLMGVFAICLVSGLKEGVARIVRMFGDKLLAFKFPPRTAQKLQGFLDYC
ncbi:hypothetical protein P691DRAFT_765765 [Macrolepiota fuliginosa MF-IS2]|uniref:Nucleoporin NDC1 n=1 Tax=Macrolepiota fuliginosa MF-IS2 TaxID=1400762 RepID=A0A9P5WZA5_9AGAR|nr:hypothetical protein P691DRAFT_765765 [Macrolepiota fuliginosa MF-IS2]